MSAIINHIANLPFVPAIVPSSTPVPVDRVDAGQREGSDTVEFSAFGQALSQATELSSLSVARVRAFRAEIENGTFETPERITGTAARLLDIV